MVSHLLSRWGFGLSPFFLGTMVLILFKVTGTTFFVDWHFFFGRNYGRLPKCPCICFRGKTDYLFFFFLVCISLYFHLKKEKKKTQPGKPPQNTRKPEKRRTFEWFSWIWVDFTNRNWGKGWRRTWFVLKEQANLHSISLIWFFVWILWVFVDLRLFSVFSFLFCLLSDFLGFGL